MGLKPTFLFLWYKSRTKPFPVEVKSIVLGKHNSDIYLATSKPKGTIIFIHGMSLLGAKDPRQMAVCASLAKAGYLVIAPDFREIRQTCITEKSIENLIKVALAVLEKKELSPKGKVAFFAPSFSAAIAIRAAAHKLLQHRVSAICSVGTFMHVDHVIHFVLENEESDDYARLIILKNFIELAIGKNPNLKKALEKKISDNWHRRSPSEAEYPKFLDKLKKPQREKIESLVSNREIAKKYFELFLPKIKDLSQKINPYYVLDNLSCALLLLHGAKDQVIPPEESVLLYHELKKRKIPAKLVVTSFISHGDNKISFFRIIELFQLLKAFCWYFGRV